MSLGGDSRLDEKRARKEREGAQLTFEDQLAMDLPYKMATIQLEKVKYIKVK